MALFGCNNDNIQEVRAGEGGHFSLFFYPNITSLTTFSSSKHRIPNCRDGLGTSRTKFPPLGLVVTAIIFELGQVRAFFNAYY
jgi:hypothetical protein